MAWTTPKTNFNAGNVLTAAEMNAIGENLFYGQPVFTNEAARDAAISAPVEGMKCYLTAPTKPAATGDTTSLPSGLTTVYNGSAWVCVSPISAYTLALGTTTSTSYTATLSGSPGTNVSVTCETGTTAIVTINAELWNSGAGGSISAAAVSGATTVAAADGLGVTNSITTAVSGSKTYVITGLTAGTNTFTLQYRVGAGTGSFRNRSVTVSGVA